MVFFTCNACGSCIKKPAMDKHVYQCRGYRSASCMDCNKDFFGSDYKTHYKCITELEKYSGEGWKAPTGHNKGEKKQNAWIDTVQATAEKAGKNATPAVKSLLQALTRHDNVPRKKPKFMNFVHNISKNYFDAGTIESVWMMLEAQWKSEKEPPKVKPAEIEDIDEAPKKGKKRKGGTDKESTSPKDAEDISSRSIEVGTDFDPCSTKKKKKKKSKDE